MAGVSIKTVSRVMNAEPYVTDAVKEKVTQAIQALDYRPNASARSLPGSRSYLIALLFDDPASGYASGVQSGAISRCRDRGYHLIVEKIVPGSEGLQQHVSQLARALRLDGAIVAPPACDDPAVLAGLEAAGVAYVRIAPDKSIERSSSVYIDDEAAAFEMTAALVQLGHREIGFIKGDPTHGATRQRLAGYLAALQQFGLERREAWISDGDFSFRSGLAAAETMFASGSRPTAIFASNDDMALGVLAAAGRAGISVPGQLSVAGFDDSPGAKVVWPQLTTVRQPNAEMAATAVDLLVDQAAAKSASPEPTREPLTFELMMRESTGPRQA